MKDFPSLLVNKVKLYLHTFFSSFSTFWWVLRLMEVEAVIEFSVLGNLKTGE